MAHFAKIENGIVSKVIVVANATLNNAPYPESESAGQAFIASIGLEGEWRQTSYNSNFRGTYAGIGYIYDAVTDTFTPPEPQE